MEARFRKYETVIVTTPDLTVEEKKKLHEKVLDFIKKHNGELLTFEVWGKRRLAYPIKKQQKGYYTYYVYIADQNVVQDLVQWLRIQDSVLRYLTIKLEDNVDPAKYEGVEKHIEEFPVEEQTEEIGEV